MINLIPISDVNPTKRFPVITVLLIVLNIIVFVGKEPVTKGDLAMTKYFYETAPVPCQLGDRCDEFIPGPGEPEVLLGAGESVVIPERDLGGFLMAVLFSTFLHANLLHIGGNLLFLWVFGNNVEDHLGRFKFTLFYLLGGIFAAFAHIIFSLQTSPATCNLDLGACVPAVGASGAIAAVMGAYIVLYPRARVNVLVAVIFLWTIVQLSAVLVLGLWFLYQFLIAAGDKAGPSGVAWMAHVGGFVFGVVMIYLMGGRPQPPAPWRPQWGRY